MTVVPFVLLPALSVPTSASFHHVLSLTYDPLAWNRWLVPPVFGQLRKPRRIQSPHVDRRAQGERREEEPHRLHQT